VSVYFEVFIEILLLIVYEKFLLLNVTIFRGDYTFAAQKKELEAVIEKEAERKATKQFAE
ncbi:MAG: hypothetical protein CVU29_10910, partial [Betaproteobacteria bacterium HGW-Betaproteobacteria-22]